MRKELKYDDIFKNPNITFSLKTVHVFNLSQEDKFLSIVKNYNSSVDEKDQFKEFYLKVFDENLVKRKIKIYEEKEIEERKKLYIKNMIILYKNFYKPKDDNDKNLIRYTNIIKYLTRSKLLVSKSFGSMEEKINSCFDPLHINISILQAPIILDCYVEFFKILENKYKEENSNKKIILKYISKAVREMINIYSEYKKKKTTIILKI